MGSPTYNATVLVLHKTKLGESDLILTFLTQDGRQLRAVARGARKPTSSFSSRLELFSFAHVQFVQRPGLHIAREARLVDGRAPLRSDLDRFAAASPIAELLSKVAQEDLPHQRLFELANATLDALCSCSPDHAAPLCAAGLLKICSFVGFRPALRSCAACGGPRADSLRFSFEEGGYLCEGCASHGSAVYLDASLAQWLDLLLYSTYDQIASLRPDPAASAACLDVARQWVRTHVGVSLKSCGFLLECTRYR